MKILFHKELASGKWFKLSLAEQLANIGSEVSRANRWQSKDEKLFQGAIYRALELFDLTMGDARWHGRLREIARVREIFCDAVFGGRGYKSSFQDIIGYFDQFAFAARKEV